MTKPKYANSVNLPCGHRSKYLVSVLSSILGMVCDGRLTWHHKKKNPRTSIPTFMQETNWNGRYIKLVSSSSIFGGIDESVQFIRNTDSEISCNISFRFLKNDTCTIQLALSHWHTAQQISHLNRLYQKVKTLQMRPAARLSARPGSR